MANQMLAIQNKICRTANKVAVDMGYAVGTTEEAVSTAKLLDTFAVTAELLLDIRQSSIRDSYEQMTNSLARSVDSLNLAGAGWSARVSRQTDLLHQARVLEKTIEIVGDELGNWQFQPLDSEILNAALDQLEYVSVCEAEKMVRRWHEGASVCLSEQATTFSRIHYGLTVLAVTLADVPVVDSDKLYSAVNATFGATLVVDGVARLARHCFH